MVAKSSDDVVAALDDLGPNAIFTWLRIGYSSLSNALGYAHGIPLAVKTAAGAFVLFVAYQAGTKGATGIVYQKSVDLGQTWDGEVQISSRQTHASLAAVIHPTLYDVHFVYGILGEPALAAASSTYYRVLAWGVADWAVGGEYTLYTASASTALSNLSLEHRDGYLIEVAHRRASTPNRFICAQKAAGQWDLTGPNNDDEYTFPFTDTVARAKVVRDGTSGIWVIVAEQGGTWRVFTSDEAVPPGEITLDFWQSWFEPTTNEFDVAVDPLTGVVGIVQNSGNQIVYRTYDPATDTLTDPVMVDDGTSGDCHWPAITLDVTRFVVAYTRTMAGDRRQLMVTWSNNWGAKLDIAQDPGVGAVYGAWGAVNLARGTADTGAVFMSWCDTVMPDASGYRVYAGRLPIRYELLVSDALGAVDTLKGGRYIADAVLADDSQVKAAEAKAAGDALAAADTLRAGPTVADTAHAIESRSLAAGLADAVAAAEALNVGPGLSDAVAAADAAAWKQQIVCADTVVGTDAVVRIGMLLADQVGLSETFGSFVLGTVADAVHAADAVVVSLAVSEVGHLADMLGIAQAVADGVTADELVNMVYEVLEEAAAAEALGVEVHVAESGHAVDGLTLTVHADDAGHLVEAASHVSTQRLIVRLHMHSGKARLKMEGGGGR